MPARSFRYFLKNNVPNHTLVLAKEHLCGGMYTSSDWQPNPRIPFGMEVGWQSESDGIMTGTEGWVKYMVIRDSDQLSRAMIYLYWTNPWLGITNGKKALAAIDVVAECDDDASHVPDKSSFSDPNQAPGDLDLVYEIGRTEGGGSDVKDWGEAIYKLGPIYTVPVYMIGGAGISNYMEVHAELRAVADSGSILLPPPGAKTRSVDTNPAPKILSGTWSGESVTVAIRRTFTRLYDVTVAEQSIGKPLNFEATCPLGHEGLKNFVTEESSTNALLASNAILGSHLDASRVSVASAAVRAALTSNSLATENKHDLLKHLHSVAQSFHVSDSPILRQISAAAAAHLQLSDYTLFPGFGVSLQLYEEYVGTQFNGYSLHYLRLTDDGRVITDAFLAPQVNLH